MKIRQMRERDLDAVLEVIERHDDDDAEAAEEYFEVYFDEFYEEGEDGDIGDRHFVAEDEGGRVIGVGGALEDEEEGEGIWWLGWFYVDPDARRRGIGAALLERSLSWAREQGGRKIYVDVSALDLYDAARAFYAKHGFVEEGRLRDYYAPGEDCVLMGRPL